LQRFKHAAPAHFTHLTHFAMILSAYLFSDGVEYDLGNIAHCADEIRAGRLVGMPTETVYGLGADADNASAVAKIFQAKGRPSDHPLIVHVSDWDGGQGGVAHYCERVPAFAHALMAAFWPGPLTLILPRKEGVASASAGGQNSIGVRCPAHPIAQALLGALRKPGTTQAPVWGIAAPSANRFGRISPTTAAHVESELAHTTPGGLTVLDGGPCSVGIESTIVDCTRGVPVLLRPGAISSADIERACGMAPLSATQAATGMAQAPRASGTLASHYAPHAQLRLMDALTLQQALHALPDAPSPHNAPATIAIYARSQLENFGHKAVLVQRMPADAVAAAQALFAALRALDAHKVAQIWVEQPPADWAWDGVRDRLQRAAA
jgi:L-threonylcarbamoyladenylate synthase